MSTIKTHLTSHRDVAMVVFVAAVFILAVVYSVFSATTISDNINTGGTLTVSGNSSVAQVSSSSNIYATSTLQATGNILGYNNLGVGTTTPGTKLAVHGGATFLGGATTIYGTLNIPYLQSTSTTASYFTGSLGIGTTTPGTALAVHAANTLLGGPTTIYGPLNLAYFNATSTTASYLSGNLGIGTTTPGTALAVHGANTLLGGPTTIYGPLSLSYLQATSTTASYFTGSLGIGTTTPGAALAVNGPGIFVGTSTIFGGINLESVSATGTLGFYTRGTAAPRLVIDSSGNVGVATSGPGALLSVGGAGLFTATSTILSGGLIAEGVTAPGILGFYTRGTAAPRLVIDSSGNLGVATSGPATTLSTVGSGYFTAGLGVGYATTGSGNLLVNDLAVIRGRLGVNATTSPDQQVGVLGDVYAGPISTTASTTITLESGGVRAGCIELRNAAGTWVSIYAGAGSATSTTATAIGVGNQFQGGLNTGILVIAQGRCDDTD